MRNITLPFLQTKFSELRYKVAADFLVNTIDYKTGADRVVKKLKDAGLTLIIASTTRKANMDIYRTQNKNIMQKANLDHYFTKIFTKEDAKKINLIRKFIFAFCVNFTFHQKNVLFLKIPWWEWKPPRMPISMRP